MKKLHTILITALCFIFFNLIYSIAYSQYRPINPDIEGIYLCEPISDFFSEKYVSRSTLEKTFTTPNGVIYIPFRTLTDRNDHHECGLIATNNWLGKTITHELNLKEFVFEFEPVKYNEVNERYDLTASQTISIPDTLIVGQKFMINQFIEAEVISESVETWNGIQLQKQTIHLINSGNSEYKWDSGDIILTKDQGIYNFPNLQYFPFEWKNVTLAGITQGQIGLQDVSNKDTYRMSQGDEYTAEYKLSYFQQGITTNFFDRIKCLSVIDEDEFYQLRSIQKERLHIVLPLGSWEYTVDTIQENIIYDQQQIKGRANETIDPEFPNTALVVIRENGYKYLNDYLPSFSMQYCYQEHIDACYNYFAFKGGFTTYFDCSGIFSLENFYLPVHRIVDGEEFGDDVFDSIKTLKNKTLDLSEALIYPNPNNGNFSIEVLNNLEISNYCLIDINGKRQKITPSTRTGNTSSFDLISAPGIYVLQGQHVAGRMYNLGKIIVAK